jgi:hypothetical protein
MFDTVFFAVVLESLALFLVAKLRNKLKKAENSRKEPKNSEKIFLQNQIFP